MLDCSTTSADAAREAAERVRRAGGEFLDCPVTGGTEGARQGTLAIMVRLSKRNAAPAPGADSAP